MAGTPRRKRAERSGLATALVVSAVLHGVAALLLAGIWVLAHRPPTSAGPLLDTRTEAEVTIDLNFREVSVEPPDIRPSAPATPPAAPTPPARRPEVIPVPSVLPANLLAVIRRPDPPPAAVVEVPFVLPTTPLAGPRSQPASDVQPAAATANSESPVKPAAGAEPLHGVLKPKQAIVYVLDASGSMGRAGKFTRARQALLATLRTQPPTVRFQVVVYSGTARAVLSTPDGGCGPVTPESLAVVERALAAVEPSGRSSHLDGLQAALTHRPDLVLFLTDADDLPILPFRRLISAAPKPTTVCVGRLPESGPPLVAELW